MNGISRLAVVNRGEAAMRALHAVADLNRRGDCPPITTVVLHTDPDAGAMFVREADEAINLGPATVVDPVDGVRRSAYLDEERVVDAMLAARIDAAWVGWGFAAEHASFADLCQKAGIVFVGPDSATIRLLGDKIAAKRLAERVDVPVVPWSGGTVDTVDEALRAADALGFPVVLKAAAGGGGRGIRVVRERADLPGAYSSARAEAQLAFGDPALFLERLVARARHVEVQIIADGAGGTWAVGVRDCSVQRRNQKVLEESASTVLDTASEQSIRAAAVRLADAAGYRSAGTVEFLVDLDTMDARFMEVNTRLQVEHPVTEETTGLDLVALQLHVAAGGRLEGTQPEARGHSIEARLCVEDEEFEPAPGRIALWRAPSGPGIRVDSGVAQGDEVSPHFDSLVAKIVSRGRDRAEAIARLVRALEDAAFVVDGGSTNRSLLIQLLRHPDFRAGDVDNRWLDRLTRAGDHRPRPDALAVLLAAVEAYESDERDRQRAFHARARRGRPELREDSGHETRLRYRGSNYGLTVYRTDADEYTVVADGRPVRMQLRSLGPYERRVSVGGRTARVVVSPQRASFLVEIDGVAHRVHREDGGVVRATGPAFVLDVLVTAGDAVEAGDPLVLVETMKMESRVVAPFAGTVAEVLVAAKTQVEPGAPLLRVKEAHPDSPADPAERIDVAGLAGEDRTRPRRPLQVLHRYLLGFDLDPAALATAFAEHAGTAGRRGGDIPDELELVRLFADLCALSQPQPDPIGGDTSALEHLRTYLQWLDPDRAGLPDGFRADLTAMLVRYGVTGLDRTPELDAAVVRLWRACRRADECAPAVIAFLEQRLHARVRTPVTPGPELRAVLGRLAEAAQARFPVIADLARDLLFHYLDEPLLEQSVAGVFAEMDEHLAALRDDPARPDREERIRRLVWCPQPMRGALLARWADADDAFRTVLLEVHVRRHYRTRDLHHVRFEQVDGLLLGCADYEFEQRRVHLVAFYTPEADLLAASNLVARHLATVDPDRLVVLDIVSWRHAPRPAAPTMSDELRDLLDRCDFGRPLHRVDVSTTSPGEGQEHTRTGRFTFRARADGFVEEILYRNLHPMIAKRLDVWRLSNFVLERLPSVEDVYLFRGVARDNPGDVRLFALAEVRDLTAVRDERGRIVSLPLLERMGLQSLAAMRDAMAALPPKKRPQGNRIVLYVRPPFDVPAERWPDLAMPFQPLAATAALHKIVLRVAIPDGDHLTDTILEITGRGAHDVRVRARRPDDRPVQPLTAYRQKVLRAAAAGAPYPYEIVRMLTPDDGMASDFPRGRFVEHDLDGAGRLVPVDRPYGGNSANLVVGLITNHPPAVPEGMSRVVLLGDPTRRLGSLAEAECRRIIAALDLAEQRGIPVEWFALSSGARIAIDSGTENMDWIGAVLRRLIDFTQHGGEVNVVVTGINVGAQPYWNAEATMLMHTRGILVMTPDSAMVLTGKQALDFSGGVSAEDNFGIGGFERVMGPNGQGQYWAPTLQDACQILMRHYEHTYVVPGERYPRRRPTADPRDRDVRDAPHHRVPGTDFTTVGDVFSAELNGERKKPFDIRSVMRAVTDADAEPLERWARWRGAESAVVWDAHVGGIPVCLIGMESRSLARRGFLPADGPSEWTSGTLFPQSSRKVARAVNAVGGNRPLVVLANLSGFDGSPESMRHWQLEYGAEIGRAVTNFGGPIVFVVISRYHGGAFVVFSKQLNRNLEVAAVEGSYASVIGGAPAAGVVLVREVEARTDRDERIRRLREQLAEGDDPALRVALRETREAVRAEKLGEVAAEFDAVHDIRRALAMGSVDRIIPAAELRPYVIDAVERGMARTG